MSIVAWTRSVSRKRTDWATSISTQSGSPGPEFLHLLSLPGLSLHNGAQFLLRLSVDASFINASPLPLPWPEYSRSLDRGVLSFFHLVADCRNGLMMLEPFPQHYDARISSARIVKPCHVDLNYTNDWTWHFLIRCLAVIHNVSMT